MGLALLPIWIFFFIGIGLLFVRSGLTLLRTAAEGPLDETCPCGYDLRATPVHLPCPECGGMRRIQPISRSHSVRVRYLYGFSLIALLLIPVVASRNSGIDGIALVVFLAATPLLWAAWRAYSYLDDAWYLRVIGATAMTFGLMVSPWLLLVWVPDQSPMNELELFLLTSIAVPVSSFVFVRMAFVARRELRRIRPPRAS